MSQGRKKSNRDSKKFIESEFTGVVKRYNDTAGYGFIKEDGTYRDVFFHISAVQKNIRRRGDPIRFGDEVIYDLYLSPKGYRAESVRILNRDVDTSDSDDTDSDDYESDDISRSHIRSSNGSTWRTRSSSRGRKQTYQEGQTGVKENSPEFKFFYDDCNDYHNSSKKENETANVNVKTESASKSFPDFDSQRTAFQTNRNGSEFTYPQSRFSFQRTQQGGTSTQSNPQPTTGTTGKPYSFFDHLKTLWNKMILLFHYCCLLLGSGKSKADTEKNPSTTLSSFSRARGNALFRLARDQRFDKSISYKSALACYKKAYNLASRDEDLVSAAKNAATTCWRLATLKMATGCASDQKVIHEYFKDALQYFSKAYPKRNCKGQGWAKHLEKSIQECLHDIRTWIEPKDEDDRIVALTEYLGYLPSCGAKVEGYLYIATIYFKKGKEALKFDEYENCQGHLKDCRVPLGEAEKMCDNVDPIIRLDVTALKKNVEYHEGLVKRSIARAKDAQARQQRELAEAKEKEIAMDQLKTDIKALDLLLKLSIELFVKQVYQSWPPKGTKETQPSLTSSTSSSSSQKKLLIRAISHYHPDKVDKNVHGIKWQLLSCEITKCLSKRLDIIK